MTNTFTEFLQMLSLNRSILFGAFQSVQIVKFEQIVDYLFSGGATYLV